MTTIKLSSPRQLGPAVRALSRQFDGAVLLALRKAARYGATQAVRVSAQTKPFRPRATGTFERSFIVIKVPDGAVLTNSARHSIFVELGRRPGKRPPLQPIIDWVKIRRIAKGGAARRVAMAIARKIGRRGTPGKFVFKRTMPIIAKRLPIEISLAMSRAVAAAARRTR